MKLTKLFTSAAVAALISGAAYGQAADYQIAQVEFTETGGSSSVGGLVTTPAGAFTGGTYYIASEIDFVGRNITGDLDLILAGNDGAATPNLAAFAASATEARLRIDFPGFRLTAPAAADPVTACTSVITDGGASGDSFIEVTIADLRDCDATVGTNVANVTVATPANDGQFIEILGLPVAYQGGSVVVTSSLVATSNDAAIAGGTDSFDANTGTTSIDPLIANAPGFQALVKDAGGSALDLEDYEVQLDGFASLVNTNQANLRVNVGSFDIVQSGAIVGAITVNEDLDGTQLRDTQSGSELVVTFGDITGLDLDDFEIDGNTGDVDGNTVTFDLGVLTSGANDLSIDLGDDDTGGIIEQVATYALEADFASAVDMDAQTRTGNLISIVRDGESETFEFVGDGNAATTSIFRLVGLDNESPRVLVQLRNATGGEAFEGEEFTLFEEGTETNNGELIFTGADIEEAVGGAFVRADATITVEANGITIRRFGFNAQGGLTDYAFDPAQ